VCARKKNAVADQSQGKGLKPGGPGQGCMCPRNLRNWRVDGKEGALLGGKRKKKDEQKTHTTKLEKPVSIKRRESFQRKIKPLKNPLKKEA